MADVLVVGAGPVGLTMAAELARHGTHCRVVDKLAKPSGYCKAIGVTPRTLEVWEDMGVARAMIDAGLWLTGQRLIVAGKVHDAVRNFSELPYGPLGIPQYATERILGEHLARLGVSVERGVTLAGLRDDGRRVAVTLQLDDGDSEEAEFRYVVGCDGAHSAVRRALGIGFSGDRFPMSFMLGDVVLDWDTPRGMGVFAIVPNESGAPDFFVAIPLPDRNRYRVTMIAPQELAAGPGLEHGISSELPGPSLSQLQAVADRLLPGAPRLSGLRWSSLFGISMRLADRYRAGNAFIAGDAAHIHPPTGGQGMNTGIQDAYNLAWKLALVVRGAADARLLDSYEPERRPVGADVVERTRQASMSFGRERVQTDPRVDAQVLISYRGSALVKDGGGSAAVRAGDRAPDVLGLRRAQVGFPLRLFDVLQGTEHVLVCCLSAEPSAAKELENNLENLACMLREHYAGLARMVAIVRDAAAAPDIPGVVVLSDEAGTFARLYGAKPGFTCLVRPDGHLCYGADRFDADEVLSALALSAGLATPPCLS